MIDSIRPALGLRLIRRTVYVAPLAGSIDSTASRIRAFCYPSKLLRRRIWICLLQLIQAFSPAHCAGLELVVLVFEQDVERG